MATCQGSRKHPSTPSSSQSPPDAPRPTRARAGRRAAAPLRGGRRIIGLAADKAYRVRLPADAPENPETGGGRRGQDHQAGQLVHRLVRAGPARRRLSYNEIYGAGSFGRIPGLDLPLRRRNRAAHALAAPDRRHIHRRRRLAVRVMRDGATDALITGAPPAAGARRPQQNPGQFAGCCYTMVTHAARASRRSPPRSGRTDVRVLDRVDLTAAAASCALPDGEPPSPRRRAGTCTRQKAGNVMDFASEPWDATCEAEGPDGRHRPRRGELGARGREAVPPRLLPARGRHGARRLVPDRAARRRPPAARC